MERRPGKGTNQYQQRGHPQTETGPAQPASSLIRQAIQALEPETSSTLSLSELSQTIYTVPSAAWMEQVERYLGGPSCPPEQLQQILQQPKHWLRRAVINASQQGLRANSPDVNMTPTYVDRPILRNPRLPQEAMRQYVDSPIHELGGIGMDHLASNPACPADLLERIYKSEQFVATRVAVLNHPACPPELLQRTVQKSKSNLVAAALQNPALPEAVLQIALQRVQDLDDPGWQYVSEGLALNARTPRPTIERILDIWEQTRIMPLRGSLLNSEVYKVLSALDHPSMDQATKLRYYGRLMKYPQFAEILVDADLCPPYLAAMARLVHT